MRTLENALYKFYHKCANNEVKGSNIRDTSVMNNTASYSSIDKRARFTCGKSLVGGILGGFWVQELVGRCSKLYCEGDPFLRL